MASLKCEYPVSPGYCGLPAKFELTGFGDRKVVCSEHNHRLRTHKREGITVKEINRPQAELT